MDISGYVRIELFSEVCTRGNTGFAKDQDLRIVTVKVVTLMATITEATFVSYIVRSLRSSAAFNMMALKAVAFIIQIGACLFNPPFYKRRHSKGPK